MRLQRARKGEEEEEEEEQQQQEEEEEEGQEEGKQERQKDFWTGGDCMSRSRLAQTCKSIPRSPHTVPASTTASE
jgi:hypothetical protein